MTRALIALLILILSAIACKEGGEVSATPCSVATQKFEANPNEATAALARQACWQIQPR